MPKYSKVPELLKKESKQLLTEVKVHDSNDFHIVDSKVVTHPEIVYIATKNFGKYKQGEIVDSQDVTIENKLKKNIKKAELLIDNTSDIKIL